MKTPEPKPRLRPHAKRIASTGGQFVISDELWTLMEPLLNEEGVSSAQAFDVLVPVVPARVRVVGRAPPVDGR